MASPDLGYETTNSEDLRDNPRWLTLVDTAGLSPADADVALGIGQTIYSAPVLTDVLKPIVDTVCQPQDASHSEQLPFEQAALDAQQLPEGISPTRRGAFAIAAQAALNGIDRRAAGDPRIAAALRAARTQHRSRTV